jgi:hypothetical protein
VDSPEHFCIFDSYEIDGGIEYKVLVKIKKGITRFKADLNPATTSQPHLLCHEHSHLLAAEPCTLPQPHLKKWLAPFPSFLE